MSKDRIPEKLYIKELNLNLLQPNSDTYKNHDQGGCKHVVIGKPGCFAIGTKIIMFNGEIKNVENIKVNDQVMGDDSKPRNVLELCYNVDDMYKIFPTYGNPVIVNKQHILSLKSKYTQKIIDITVENYISKSKSFKKIFKWFRTCVEFPEKELIIDPYTVGKWLINTKDVKNTQKNYIPEQYKINSKYNRLRLLSSIIDTIVYKKDLNHYWICSIFGKNLNDIPTNLKNNLIINKQKDNLLNNFFIEFLEKGDYYGFTIDGNNRFLLEDFSVVHNTGKSTLISSLLYSKKDIYPCGIVFSGTEDSNGFYKKTFPSTFVFNKYDEIQLESFIKRQKISKKYVDNPWALCLLDDCTDTPSIFNKPLQQGIFKNSRHWKMWYILSLQYCMDIKPVIRTNVDGTFILREPNLKNRKSLWENYAGIIPDFSQFCTILDCITDDFTALYIHNSTKSNKLEDCLFWYKAEKPPDSFKFGCPEFWEFHYSRYNSDYIEPYL